MARVNYIKEMESFRDWAEANAISGSERLLWQALFHQCNARAFKDEWPDGFIEIRNRELVALSGLSRVTVWRARERLARRGILDFIPGGGDQHSTYKLHYLSLYGAPAAVDKSGTLVDNRVQIEQGGVQNEHGGVQIETGCVQNEQGSVQNEQGREYVLHNDTEINPCINIINKEEEDTFSNYVEDAPARDTMVKEFIEEVYRAEIGRAATPAELREIGEIAEWNRADGSLVREAIRRGASANYPARYAVKCLMSWGDVGLRSLEELDTYERYIDITNTPRPDIAEKGREKLEAFLREIKIKHRMVAI